MFGPDSDAMQLIIDATTLYFPFLTGVDWEVQRAGRMARSSNKRSNNGGGKKKSAHHSKAARSSRIVRLLSTATSSAGTKKALKGDKRDAVIAREEEDDEAINADAFVRSRIDQLAGGQAISAGRADDGASPATKNANYPLPLFKIPAFTEIMKRVR